ncbi:type II toxin-antitoxin system Phd/YefM family antitoxin [Altericista sp. CCNU0014]|uniref:type II toxin-antitoxin system Phd/YefM family antitoxin n=1 Tax=Altericista sp. CCNU0014 TaxID=3082949 RepID=UPI00384D37D7
MTINISVTEAEAKISELFQQIRKGEEVIILENGHELARVIPNKQLKARRIPGIDEGKIIFAPDFEDPLPEDILKAFEGLDVE